MAPEPCATHAIEEELGRHEEWVLDGFPRSHSQLLSPMIKREAIVYLDISQRLAIKRAIARHRNSPEIERYRIVDQSRLLAPVRAMAAVIIPCTFRSPEQVIEAVIRWYEDNIHPSELGSNAR